MASPVAKTLQILIPLGLLLGGGVTLWTRSAPPERPAMVDPAEDATYGELYVDSDQGPLRLSDLRGQVVLVYFGYTACPDICPTTLATTAAAVEELPPEQATQVTAMFVSVDPKRDTPALLGDYARYFNPRFVAGTAEPAAISEMAADWGVAFAESRVGDGAMEYTVDHSTSSYLVDKQGQMVRVVPHGTPPAVLAGWMRELL